MEFILLFLLSDFRDHLSIIFLCHMFHLVVTLFSNIIHEQNTSNTNLTNKAYPGYCKHVFMLKATRKSLSLSSWRQHLHILYHSKFPPSSSTSSHNIIPQRYVNVTTVHDVIQCSFHFIYAIFPIYIVLLFCRISPFPVLITYNDVTNIVI